MPAKTSNNNNHTGLYSPPECKTHRQWSKGATGVLVSSVRLPDVFGVDGSAVALLQGGGGSKGQGGGGLWSCDRWEGDWCDVCWCM